MPKEHSQTGLCEAAIISMMVKSGLRLGMMGNHNGTDGLRMHDLFAGFRKDLKDRFSGLV